MQTFLNPAIPANEPGHVWQFEDDVRVEVSTVTVGDPENPTTEERRQFFAPHGARLNVPDTLVPGELPVPPEPTLDDLKAAKVVALSDACREEILSGFECNALGATHHYPTKETDQLNLASSVLSSLIIVQPWDWTTPFWCADTEGVWAFRDHTADQIQQVGREAKAAILSHMGKNATLAAQAMLAEDAIQLAKINWNEPEPAPEEPPTEDPAPEDPPPDEEGEPA